MDVRRSIPCFVLIILSLIPLTDVKAQEQLWVGPNVNMVSGTTWPDGDPFLQRQNEPSIAVSTRRPLTVMAASNDYRTVDLPGLPDIQPIADSWIGVYTSLDGGGSWTSTLLPGYPQDQSAEGLASPIHGLQAAADPVMRAGTHGLFYLSGIAFDRGLTPQSKLFVARFVDLNNNPNDPIQYIDTVEVASYIFPSEVFIDKPWLAVDIPRDGATCGTVYLAWAEIESAGDTVVESRIMFSTSTDCGSTWDIPHPISDPGTINQGATVAVAPATGDVFVSWRQLSGLGVGEQCGMEPGDWLHATDDWPFYSLIIGGVLYDQAGLIDILASPGSAHGDARYILARQLIAAKLSQFDAIDPTGAGSVMAEADAWLAVHPFAGPKPRQDDKEEGTALADQLELYNSGLLGPIGCSATPGLATEDAIIVAAAGAGGGSFDPPSLVRPLAPFEAFDQATTELSFRTTAYPTMTVDATGRVYIAWTERGEALPSGDGDPIEGDSRIVVGTSLYPFSASPWTDVHPIDQPEVPGHQVQPTITTVNNRIFLVYNDFRLDSSGVFDRFVVDYLTPEHPYRHTVDVRAAVAEPGPSPVFTDYSLLPPANPSAQVSKYFCIPTIQGGFFVFLPLERNPPNLPMFKAGTVPFFGDYVDIAGAPPFIPDGHGGWTYNTSPTITPVAHAVWTDNRDVVGPPDGDWTSFVPPGNGGTSVFDGATPVPACDPETDDIDRTRMRNQNIYTSRLTAGLHVSAPGIWRPLNTSFQRAFVVFVENGTDESKAFRLEILDQPPDGQASFGQFEFANFTDVAIEPHSSASRTVYVTSSDATSSIEVLVSEIDALGGNPVPGGLQSSALINPDPSNPYPADPSLMTGEIYTPAVFNPAVYNPAVYNPAVFNPAVFNPAVFNPAVFNDAVLNFSVTNPAVFNPAVLNPAVFNPAVFNPAVFNQAIVAMSLLNPAVFNPAVYNTTYFNPAVFNPAVFNPAVFNPAVLNPAVFNPAVFNPAVFNPAVLNPAVFNTALDDSTALDLNLVAYNEGNTTSAYSLNLAMLEEPQGFSYQLMVYRLYFTPVVNGCELTEAAQQELIVYSLDPDLGADLLDPEGDVSFFLNPDEYAVITLRITPDPQNPGDPSTFPLEELAVAMVAQAVAAADVAAGETRSTYDTFAPLALDIYTTELPGGNQLSPYSANLLATGGSGAYVWSLVPGSGSLPDGLGLSPTGAIAGTPTIVGTFSFTVEVTDGLLTAQRELSISIAPAGGGPVFLVQPSSGTAGESLAPFSVLVLDNGGVPIPGLTVTLNLATAGCASASLSPPVISAVTGPDGIADFWSVSIDRGGFGFTLAATTMIFATPVTDTSDPFNLVGFCESGTLGTPREDHTSTLLDDGRVLVTGGTDDLGTQLSSAELYDPIGGSFSPTTGPMAIARTGHTATLLETGHVLITGGFTGAAVSASAELYDPSTGTFIPTGSMGTPRHRHTATLLPSGRVLIAGGSDDLDSEISVAELYDPATGIFTPTTGGLAQARCDHTATLMADGRVFVAGGTVFDRSTIFSTAEIYDPTTDTFNMSLSMGTPRSSHTAVLLTDGTVLLTGGLDSPSTTTATAVVFDPFAGTIDPTGSMDTARSSFTVTLLDTGQALVVGGFSGTGLVSSAEVFDPLVGTFSWVGDLIDARQSQTTTLLDSGQALVVGGNGVAGTEDSSEVFFRQLGATLTVTNTDNSGPGSLRSAILAANSDADLDTIAFDIPGAGPHTIAPLSALPVITRPVAIDGTTQPGYAGSPVIELDGSSAGGTSGLQISAGSSTVQGLVINGFSGNGILLYSHGRNRIQGNFIGTDVTGTVALHDQTNGVLIFRSSNNAIGGTTAAQQNVIAGNTFWGIRLDRSDGNTILGNWIGTNPSYAPGLGNGERGISNWYSNNTLIGRTDLSAGNVSVGNASSGIQIYGSTGAHVEGNHVAGNGGTGIIIDGGSHHTTVVGNLIGTDSTGTLPAGNTLSGVFILDSWDNRIGGPGGRNIISANRRGVYMRGHDNVVENNYIGTDITGTVDLGNDEDGVWFNSEGHDNHILDNLISGNGRDGVSLSWGAVRNTIENNRIGINAGADAALPNDSNGVLIEQFSNENTVVGNVVAGNLSSGVLVESSSDHTVIQGNWVGTNPSLDSGLGNGDRGIAVADSDNTLIGGADPAERNVVVGNTYTGIILYSSSSTRVEGNLISENGGSGIVIESSDAATVVSNLVGTDATGTLPMGNNRGIMILTDSTGVVIGGPTGRNIVSGNLTDGIWINEADVPIPGENCLIENNFVGTNLAGTAALPNQGAAPTFGGIIANGDSARIRGNLVAGNTGWGIRVAGGSANVVEDNLVGTNADGDAPLPNGRSNILVDVGAADTVVRNNLASGATQEGIEIVDASGTIVTGNLIGTDISGTLPLGNTTQGVAIYGSSSNTLVGGPDPEDRNLISGNAEGISIGGPADNTVVEGNYVGTSIDGSAAVGNTTGIRIDGSPNTVVRSNLVSGSLAGPGVLVQGGATGTAIDGNIIGTNASVTAKMANSGGGISIYDSGTVSTTVTGNVVSGNDFHGIDVNYGATDVTITGNYIGTNASGSPGLGNQHGGVRVEGGAHTVTIGGTSPGEANVISANGISGVIFAKGPGHTVGTHDNVVQGNWIGTNPSLADLGNVGAGIDIDGYDNLIGGAAGGAGNTIAHNGSGIIIWNENFNTGNEIVSNSIFANEPGLGIDLGNDGVTANDLWDGDTGANELINFPELDDPASDLGGFTRVTGVVRGLATEQTTRLMQIYASSSCDPSGYGEGEALVYEIGPWTIPAMGAISWSADIPMSLEGSFLTAVAISGDVPNSTSEFSPCVQVIVP